MTSLTPEILASGRRIARKAKDATFRGGLDRSLNAFVSWLLEYKDDLLSTAEVSEDRAKLLERALAEIARLTNQKGDNPDCICAACRVEKDLGSWTECTICGKDFL